MAVAPPIAPLDKHRFVEVLSYTGDRGTFRALRVLSAEFYHAGEAVRFVCDAKRHAMETAANPEWHDIWPDIFRRMSFWTPWYIDAELPTLRIWEMQPSASFQELWDLDLFRSRGRGQCPGCMVHGCSSRHAAWCTAAGMRYVTVYGCSSRNICFHQYLDCSNTWVRWQEIYYSHDTSPIY